eukprot:Colp12_sorted_trinity150504_noHs@34281
MAVKVPVCVRYGRWRSENATASVVQEPCLGVLVETPRKQLLIAKISVIDAMFDANKPARFRLALEQGPTIFSLPGKADDSKNVDEDKARAGTSSEDVKQVNPPASEDDALLDRAIQRSNTVILTLTHDNFVCLKQQMTAQKDLKCLFSVLPLSIARHLKPPQTRKWIELYFKRILPLLMALDGAYTLYYGPFWPVLRVLLSPALFVGNFLVLNPILEVYTRFLDPVIPSVLYVALWKLFNGVRSINRIIAPFYFALNNIIKALYTIKLPLLAAPLLAGAKWLQCKVDPLVETSTEAYYALTSVDGSLSPEVKIKVKNIIKQRAQEKEDNMRMLGAFFAVVILAWIVKQF